MSKGWHEVARLGGAGARYPHLLVNRHGWCLRMGSKSNADDKLYSSLGSLFSGLVEHFVRRRMAGVAAILDLKACSLEIEDGISSALDLCRDACLRVGQERSIRLNGARGGVLTAPGDHDPSTDRSGRNRAP
jgi:hypothetical protein